jgi:hypothetical protein
LRAAAKMASVVTLIIEKTMKKYSKKIVSDLPTLIFSRYETGTTGIFLRQIIESKFYTHLLE